MFLWNLEASGCHIAWPTTSPHTSVFFRISGWLDVVVMRSSHISASSPHHIYTWYSCGLSFSIYDYIYNIYIIGKYDLQLFRWTLCKSFHDLHISAISSSLVHYSEFPCDLPPWDPLHTMKSTRFFHSSTAKKLWNIKGPRAITIQLLNDLSHLAQLGGLVIHLLIVKPC